MFKPILLASALLLPVGLFAQVADDYFHGAGQHYVHGRKAEAKLQISEGLSKFPNDPKLLAMAGLIKDEEKQEEDQKDQQKDQQDKKDKQDKQDQKQQQDQQKQEQDKQDQQQQQPSDQDKKDQQQKEQAQRDQQKKDKEKQEQERQKQKAEQQKQQQKEQPQKGEPDQKPGEPQDGEESGEAVTGMLTPQQARQILDAQKTDEKMLPVDLPKPPDKPGAPRRIKDW